MDRLLNYSQAIQQTNLMLPNIKIPI